MNAARKRIGWGIAGALVGLGAIAGACGDDGGSSGSGVSGSKTVNEVTDDDAKKLCLWTFEQTKNIEISDRDACEVGASIAASSTSECNTIVTACLKDPPEPDTDIEPECDDAEAEKLPEACSDLTVRDYESCLRGIFSSYREALTSMSCSTVGGDIPSFADAKDDLPASCEKISKTCPELLPSDLFGDDDGE